MIGIVSYNLKTHWKEIKTIIKPRTEFKSRKPIKKKIIKKSQKTNKEKSKEEGANKKSN